MINIKCVETGDVYQLSGDDESFNVVIYSDIAASLAGMVRDGTFLKMHKKELEYRIALARLTGFNHAFHAHERACTLMKNAGPKLYVASTPTLIGKSYYQEFMRKRNEERFQTKIKYTGTP